MTLGLLDPINTLLQHIFKTVCFKGAECTFVLLNTYVPIDRYVYVIDIVTRNGTIAERNVVLLS